MQLRKIVFAGAALLSLVGGGAKVSALEESSAWGPQDRATYTWANPSLKGPVFNSITDNPEIGNERNFVRVKEYGVSGAHLDTVDVYAGKQYEVYIYYHNNAAAALNSSGLGIANNVRVASAVPVNLEPGQAGKVIAEITSTNTLVPKVWDSAYLIPKEKVYLKYVSSSAVIHNAGSANGTILNADLLFSETGTKIAHWNSGENDWGKIPGCNEYAGYITYRLEAVAVEEPKQEEETPTVTPTTPTETPTETETKTETTETTTPTVTETKTETKAETVPDEIPTTGPAEIIFAALIVVGIGFGIWYYLKSRKELEKISQL